jgi:hypothetical protein
MGHDREVGGRRKVLVKPINFAAHVNVYLRAVQVARISETLDGRVVVGF